MNFCSQCGKPVTQRIPEGDGRLRFVCDHCSTIHYQNRTGVSAACSDCHVPKEWVHKVVRKIQASNEVLHKVLGTIDIKIQKYIGPSPGSPGMPAEAPGNTASWLGWQIVKSYMKAHPQTTLPQLLEMKDAQAILDQSGYRPPR